MHSFDLLENFVKNPEALLRRTKAKLKKVSALEQEDNHQIRRSLTPEFEAMANKTTRILYSNHRQHPYWTDNRCWRQWIRNQASSH
jgi:hypothetical protein